MASMNYFLINNVHVCLRNVSKVSWKYIRCNQWTPDPMLKLRAEPLKWCTMQSFEKWTPGRTFGFNDELIRLNRFNAATFLYLSQVRIWMSIGISYFLLHSVIWSEKWLFVLLISVYWGSFTKFLSTDVAVVP
jgi:hypothetical protein